MIAEEVALLNQDRGTGLEKAIDQIYGERLLQPTGRQLDAVDGAQVVTSTG